MKINPNNLTAFYLSKEENQRVFEKDIIPRFSKRFDFTPSKNPTVYLTAGLPGAGKSALVEEMIKESKNSKIFIANSDEMRPYHPKYHKAVENFGNSAGIAIHKDATIFSNKLIEYAISSKADFIIDSTLKDPKKAEELISALQDSKYFIKVTMIAVNEYESLHGIYNRFAYQYEANPATARFIDAKLIIKGKKAIAKTVKMLYRKNIDELKIIDRDHNLLYDSKVDKKAPCTIIKSATNLENFSKERLNSLLNIWDKLIIKLKTIQAPTEVIKSAKEINTQLRKEVSDIVN
jgi:hypothetical protein